MVHPFSCGIADADADERADKHANDQRNRPGPVVPVPLAAAAGNISRGRYRFPDLGDHDDRRRDTRADEPLPDAEPGGLEDRLERPEDGRRGWW